MLDKRGDLAIAILAFYTIGLPVASYVCFRQGFGRQLGWLYLVLLPVVRIVGAAMEIAAENISPPSVGLYTGAAVLYSIGLVPLLLCLMGLLKRVNDGLNVTSLHQQTFRVTHLILIVGLILAIAGGVDIIPTNSANEISTGNTLRKAGSILLLVGWLISLGMNVLFLFRLRHVWEGDRPLVYFGLASEPFLLVRLVYLLGLCFTTHSKVFNTFSPNIWSLAFMQVVMEFIVFILYCCAGVLAPGIRQTLEHDHAGNGSLPGQPSKYGQDSELGIIPGRN